MPDNVNDLLAIFNAEPTKLTKEELIELGKWAGGLKLTIKMKEATMINKISDFLDNKPKEKVEVSKSLGVKDLDIKKKYKLTLAQRSAISKRGESLSNIPSEMTGADIMKRHNWKLLGL